MQGQKTATFYIIDTTPSLENPWIPFALDTHEDSLNDIQPASIGIPVAPEEPTNREDGIFVLSSRLDRTDCMFYGLDPSSLTKTNSKSTLRGDLGKVNSMYSSRNPWTYVYISIDVDLANISILDSRIWFLHAKRVLASSVMIHQCQCPLPSRDFLRLDTDRWCAQNRLILPTRSRRFLPCLRSVKTTNCITSKEHGSIPEAMA